AAVRIRRRGQARFVAGFFFGFDETATAQFLPLSLHDALPICTRRLPSRPPRRRPPRSCRSQRRRRTRACASSSTPSGSRRAAPRSEEHTSELQSRENLVCRLLLEKKNGNAGKQARDQRNNGDV